MSNSEPTAPAAPVISRRLWLILGLLFAASFLNYLDRQTLSVLKPTIKSAFTLDEPGYALLVNVFTGCYAIAYIVTGIVVDRLGVRRAYTGFVLGWSLAAIGSGLARSWSALLSSRALLGLAEPAHAPTSVRVAALWFPPARRGLLMTVAAAGGTVGAIAAPPLTAWLALGWSWRAAFVVPGIAGVLLAVAWWSFYRDPPAVVGEPAATAERRGTLPWSQLWREKSLWGFILVRLISDPVWYFCLFWMPGYFQEQRGLSLKGAGVIAWIPFLAGNVGAICLAAFSDRLGFRQGNPLRARQRVLVVMALFGPLAALVPMVSPVSAVVTLLAVVAIVCLTWLFLLGTLVTDAFPAGNAASVWAIAGAFGSVGAMVFNYSVGQISTTLGSDRMFLILGCLHPIAAVLLVALVRKVRTRDEPVPLSAGA